MYFISKFDQIEKKESNQKLRFYFKSWTGSFARGIWHSQNDNLIDILLVRLSSKERDQQTLKSSVSSSSHLFWVDDARASSRLS